jgi:hypothetical protein
MEGKQLPRISPQAGWGEHGQDGVTQGPAPSPWDGKSPDPLVVLQLDPHPQT